MYREITDVEEFNQKQQEQIEDDKKLIQLMQEFLDDGAHRNINFVLLNIGNLLKICSIYLELKQDNIESFLKLEKESTKNKKMYIIVKEMNEKINLRYEFDEDTTVVEELYVFEGRGYIHINKAKFVSLLLEKNLLDPVDIEGDNLHEL